ncbi:hypothetical protein VNO78_31096 [Psophocarpus tetragonolobus]|uniref:Uncharacterized protein n=1 Tax=Psophocarpus tetragonolobus TaxID=3891 RepID=A0AAN9X8T7_PSOTE
MKMIFPFSIYLDDLLRGIFLVAVTTNFPSSSLHPRHRPKPVAVLLCSAVQYREQCGATHQRKETSRRLFELLWVLFFCSVFESVSANQRSFLRGFH